MDEDMQNSGFLECGIQDSFLLEGLECVYVSDAGHTQLFKGVRYGKFHILKALKEEYRGVSFYEQALQKEFAIGYGLDHPISVVPWVGEHSGYRSLYFIRVY